MLLPVAFVALSVESNPFWYYFFIWMNLAYHKLFLNKVLVYYINMHIIE